MSQTEWKHLLLVDAPRSLVKQESTRTAIHCQRSHVQKDAKNTQLTAEPNALHEDVAAKQDQHIAICIYIFVIMILSPREE